MAIEYVGGITASAINGGDPTADLTALTGGIGSSAQEDDLVVVAMTGDGGAVGVSTAGYTEWVDLPGTADVIVATKFMGATPDTSVVVEGGGDANWSTAVVVQVFRGVDQSTPQDATATTDTGASTSPQSPAITTVTDGAFVLSAMGAATTGGFTISGTPTGYTSLHIRPNDGFDTGTGLGHKEVASAGTETPGAWTLSRSIGWAAATIALRPAATVDALTSQDVTSGTPTIDQATLGIVHPLTAQDVLSGAPTIDAASLGQEHALTAQDITSGTPTIDQASLSEVVALTAQDVTAGTPTVDQATIAQVHALTVEDVIAGAPVIDAPALESGAKKQPSGGSSRSYYQARAESWQRFETLTAQDITARAPRITAPTLKEITHPVEDSATWGGLDIDRIAQGRAELDKAQTDDRLGGSWDFAWAVLPALVRETEQAAEAVRGEQAPQQAPSRDTDHRQRILRDEEEFLSLFMQAMD